MTAPALRDRESKFTAIPMEEALETMKEIGSEMNKLVETVPVNLSLLGKVVAEAVTSSENMPPTRVSTKDGYAVVASDGKTVRNVVGVALAGSVHGGVLQPGECVRISTGAVVPEGATAVVMVEHTLCQKKNDNNEECEIQFKDHVSDGTNIREPGSEVRKGDVIVPLRTQIGSAELGILSAFGIRLITVYKKPVVMVMSTGNELLSPDTEAVPLGMIRDSNGPQLIALFKEQGFDVIDGGRIDDDFESIKTNLKEKLERTDVIVTTGGVSMGEKDNIKRVLIELGMQIRFGRVMMKPGLPCTVATCANPKTSETERSIKVVLALPGNPASAWVCSHLFAIPLLRDVSGFQRSNHPQIKVRLAQDTKLGDRPEYVRAFLAHMEDEDFPIAHVTGNQISSNIGSLVGAKVLLSLPIKQDKEFVRKGELVKALVLG